MATKLGRTDEAVAALRRRVEVLDRRARDNPDLPGTAADMMNAFQSLAGYLNGLGRLDDAARVLRQGRDRSAEVTTDEGAFFSALAGFHITARQVAEARAKDSAEARPDIEISRCRGRGRHAQLCPHGLAGRTVDEEQPSSGSAQGAD